MASWIAASVRLARFRWFDSSRPDLGMCSVIGDRIVYRYEEIKPSLFTDEGQRKFLKVRDHVQKLTAQSGAVRMQEVLNGAGGGTWELMACVDRLVELGELQELPIDAAAGQHRVFVAAN